MADHKIKRGVSLYSYQHELFHGTLDTEAMIRASASFGANGIEIIPEQTYANWPNITDRQIEEWNDLHARYGTVPTASDAFMDKTRVPGRRMTHEEGLESLVRDIRLAERLGCTVLRVIINTPHEVFEAAAPYAVEHNVKLAVEVHAPMHYEHPWVLGYADIIHRVDNGYLGFMPDMGVHAEIFPRLQAERALRDGATPKFVDEIVKIHDSHDPRDRQMLPQYIHWAGGTLRDVQLAQSLTMFNYAPPEQLIPHIPYSFHIQAKFYDMVDDTREYSIPYDRIIPLLIEHGYDGYLSSEYEGNRTIEDAFPVDSIEQVRRQHAMFATLLGEDAN